MRHRWSAQMTLTRAFAAVATRLPQKVALITDRNQLSFQDLRCV